MGVGCGEGGERGEEGVGAAVGSVDVGVLGDVGFVVGVGDNIGVGVVGQGIFVAQRFVRFLVEQRNVFTRGDLDVRMAATELLGNGLDSFLAVFGKVVNEGGEEAPLFESGGDGVGLVGGVDEVAVRSDYLEEVGHVVEDLVVGGAAIEGAGAESVDCGCLAGGGGGVRNSSLERTASGFVDLVGGGRDECHGKCCRIGLAILEDLAHVQDLGHLSWPRLSPSH